MTKIEPMSVELITNIVRNWHSGTMIEVGANVVLSLILTWIEAEARARHAYHHWNAVLKVDHSDQFSCPGCKAKFEDWIAAVKAEVGWVDDK